MNSQRGVSIVTLVLVIAVLLLIAGVCAYVVVGPNGPLNPEVVKPLPETETSYNEVSTEKDA